MLAAIEWVGLSLFVTACGTTFTAVVTGLVMLRKIEAVRKEVATFNESTQGELAAEDETRRIEKIPRAKRTAKEQRHVDEAAPVDPPQGPAA